MIDAVAAFGQLLGQRMEDGNTEWNLTEVGGLLKITLEISPKGRDSR